jgi:hypothetical protein
VNEGAVDFMLRTGIKVSSDTTTTMADDVSDFLIDTDILEIKHVFLNSQTTPLRRISHFELLELRQAAGSSSNTVFVYATLGSNLFLLYPAPADADELTVYYVPRPATLSAAGDSPSEIPAEFHPAVELYALSRLASMRDDQTSAQGQRYADEYEKWVARAKRAKTLMGGSRLAPARVGRRRILPTSRSADW